MILAYLLIPILLSQSWSRFDRRCCDSRIPAGSMPILPSQSWSRFDWDCCDSSIPSDTILMPLSQFWSRFDRHCCDSGILLLSPYISASLDPDLTDTAAIHAYWYYPHIPLSQSWSRFDRRCCVSSIPSWYYPHTSQPVLIQIWPRRLWFYITCW